MTEAPPLSKTRRSTRLEDLLLIRLLPAGKTAPSSQAVRACLERYLPESFSGDSWSEFLDDLRSSGLIQPRGMRLTPEGRTRALAALGLAELPARCDWRTLESRYLLPLTAGLKSQTPGSKAPSADQWMVRALVSQMKLPIPATSTLSQAFAALVGRELGYPGETDYNRLKRRVLSRTIGSDEVLNSDQLKKQLPRVLLELPKPGPEGVRARLIGQWLSDSGRVRVDEGADLNTDEKFGDGESAADFDLPTFASTVKAAARICTAGHFGEHSAFVNHVWRYLEKEPGFPRFDLAAFKVKLLEANRLRLLDLVRADLVQAMDAGDVRESEIVDGNSSYHFVRIERESHRD